MPEMGRPVTALERSYSQVTMGPKKARPQEESNENLSAQEKQKLYNKITGYKEESIYKDGKKHNQIGKDEFLKLLSHQLQNQDPMNPMEQNKFAAELAQFSQLEQLTNLNSKFDKLTDNANLEDKFYGASFLGKEIVTSGTSVKFNGEGTEAPLMFSLAKPAQKVMIRIFDNKNNMIDEIWKENLGQGAQQLSWDGEQLDKSIAAPGEYTLQVKAWDEGLQEIDANTKVTGVVESVFFEDGESVLMVNGSKVFLRDVDSFHMPKTGLAQKASKEAQAAKMNAQNLPLAQDLNSALNLNKAKPNQTQAINAYEKSVYDE
jgi:flagellar basal-body rod modification protein FlgD